MATTEKITMKDGRVFAEGMRVRHKIYGYEGWIHMIWVADSGPTGIKIAIIPDDAEAAIRGGATWPQKGGGRFIECRDAGLSPRFWDIIEDDN